LTKQTLHAPPRIDWKNVAREVSARLGKNYSGQYVREISSGWRSHKTIAPILQELGVMAKPVKHTRATARPVAA
jgi:hypothetical protein